MKNSVFLQMQKTISYLLVLVLVITTLGTSAQSPSDASVRVAVAGITHGHVGWILGRKNKPDVELVGVYEPNKELAERYAKQYGFSANLIYDDLGKMLDAVKPEAVLAFGSIYEHLAVVEACAPRKIHVMVEKPLAFSLDHALRMEKLAKQYNIHLLTDYETSWYATTEKTFQLVNDSNNIGGLKKAIFHHGHEGPKEIHVQKEFLQWLTDPVQNGGGAIVDFGCYGANLMTYLMKGAKPISVFANIRTFKPSVYPKVDDEATIIVNYPTAQCIIQASWNWPFGRKDMEVYGDSGYVITKNNHDYFFRNRQSGSEKALQVNEKDLSVFTDPFSWLASFLRGKITMPDYGLYSLENNMTVVRILQAARESAKTGKLVKLK
jgi:predicted dehydrogenase